MKSGVQEQNTNNISERRKDSGKIAMKSLGSKLGSFERYHLRPLTADLSPYTVPLPFFFTKTGFATPTQIYTILSQDR